MKYFLQKQTKNPKKLLKNKDNLVLKHKKRKKRLKKILLKTFNIYILIYKIFVLLFLLIYSLLSFQKKAKELKVALCTMGKQENLYVKEYVNYYINLGVDHIFIYDDNDINTEKISDVIGPSYNKYVTIYENIKDRIKKQKHAFTDCYHNNKDKYDWFIMFDMDEYLYIVNNTLKNYLSSSILNECDYIRIHWKLATDNNLLHYDNRSLFERFNSSRLKSYFTKSVIRGHISNLTYGVHHVIGSPINKISCTNNGIKLLNHKGYDKNGVVKINTQYAYIIHFCYKSTEEFIKKYKRGYSNWLKNNRLELWAKINEYVRDNKMTKEKVDLFKKELNIDLSKKLK